MHFFIRVSCKSFSYFISDFVVLAETLYKGFLRSFSSKCFQSLGIDPSVIWYICYGWQWENLISWKISSRKLELVVEISNKVPNKGKFVWNIPECDDTWNPVWCVDLKIWVSPEFLIEIWGRDVDIGEM